ncbi:transcriptional regulator [Aspergillus cavernicola]|uniref:Transcriptional regulator n=1 Tax=Aspergillus cavernicola TaxID=176166 RepID=A0ABR4IBL5_9EURO
MPQPQIGDRITICNYTFTWTKAHLSKDELEPFRQKYDQLGAAALERIQTIRQETNTKSTDLYEILYDNHANDPILSQFWTEVHSVPSWVNWAQIARGQQFFYRYALANIVGFALQGFMAENSAAPGVVEVLVRTGGFSTRMLLGRLLETFQWLIQVTHCIKAIQPGGQGHTATVRVRLLHASVRNRLLQLCQRRPEYFDTETYGIPVNTLDSIHSISTFCCNPMWLQLPKFGSIPVTPGEVDDYIAVFRYLAFVLGTPTSYFETSEKAKCVMESMLVHEVRTTETSRVVAYNFVECVTNLPGVFRVSSGFVAAGSRWINGDGLCDELRLERPGLVYYLAFRGFCVLVTCLARVQRVIPAFDAVVVDLFRTQLYNGIVQRKSRTKFDFKYVPKIGSKTGKEAYGTSSTAGVSGLVGMGLAEMVFIGVLAGGGLMVGGSLTQDRQLPEESKGEGEGISYKL